MSCANRHVLCMCGIVGKCAFYSLIVAMLTTRAVRRRPSVSWTRFWRLAALTGTAAQDARRVGSCCRTYFQGNSGDAPQTLCQQHRCCPPHTWESPLRALPTSEFVTARPRGPACALLHRLHTSAPPPLPLRRLFHSEAAATTARCGRHLCAFEELGSAVPARLPPALHQSE
jgi:hypothetical protein